MDFYGQMPHFRNRQSRYLTKVTMMVNDVNERPYYALSLIEALVSQNHYWIANRRADNRIQDLGWNSSKLKSFILALDESHFIKRYPQCAHGNAQIDCDGYKMRFDDDNCVEDGQHGLEIFIKLAISNRSKTLIVSFHLEGSPG